MLYFFSFTYVLNVISPKAGAEESYSHVFVTLSLINKPIIHEKWRVNEFVDFAGHNHR